jgi:hypothetical protein
MDSIRVSEAPDPSSILGEATTLHQNNEGFFIANWFVDRPFWPGMKYCD